jgi:SAM-dependent methyltransferase
LQRAFELRDTIDTRRLFIRYVTTCTQIPLEPQLESLLQRALSDDWSNPQYLYSVCRSYLAAQPAVEAAVKRAQSEQPDPLPLDQFLGPGTSSHLGNNRLLLELIASTPVADIELERLLVRLRFSLLDAIRRLGETQSLPGQTVELCCAIARQCFLNEYIFNETPEERSILQPLIGRVETALRNGRPVAPETIAIIAAYQPLHATPFAEYLAHCDAPAPLAPVLKQQIEELVAELELRGTIPILTPVGGSDSSIVPEQFKQQPCPRWVKTSRLASPVPIDRFLQDAFPHARFKPFGNLGRVEILIAGCGTGLDAIAASQMISAADILAVDPSVSSLAFAERQTRALGIANIRYGQADIAHLPSLGRRFDVVEAVGVLPHLGDPWDGWKILLSLLRPGGVMRIGLCSALGRRNVAQAQDFVRAGNYQPDQEGVRMCRRNLLRQPADAPTRQVIDFADFYTAGQCRNLLFGTREQHVTLPQIESFLAENRLGFLGFDAPMHLLRRYAQQYAHDGAMSDLSSWHLFETGNPDSFATLYDFWVQKA